MAGLRAAEREKEVIDKVASDRGVLSGTTAGFRSERSSLESGLSDLSLPSWAALDSVERTVWELMCELASNQADEKSATDSLALRNFAGVEYLEPFAHSLAGEDIVECLAPCSGDVLRGAPTGSGQGGSQRSQLGSDSVKDAVAPSRLEKPLIVEHEGELADAIPVYPETQERSPHFCCSREMSLLPREGVEFASSHEVSPNEEVLGQRENLFCKSSRTFQDKSCFSRPVEACALRSKVAVRLALLGSCTSTKSLKSVSRTSTEAVGGTVALDCLLVVVSGSHRGELADVLTVNRGDAKYKVRLGGGKIVRVDFHHAVPLYGP